MKKILILGSNSFAGATFIKYIVNVWTEIKKI